MGSGSQSSLFGDDDASDVRSLLKEWKNLLKPLEELGRVRVDRPDGLGILDDTLRRAPASGEILQQLDEIRTRISEAVSKALKQQAADFRKAEVAFVKRLREAKTPYRELDEAWRIGPWELEVRRERGQARLLYNREQILGWSRVSSADELAGILQKGDQILEAASIPTPLLIEALWSAYQSNAGIRSSSDSSKSARVPIIDFYRAVRVSLVRSEVSSGPPDRKLRYADLPRWRFLYNVDRYRKLPASDKQGRALAFETGSMKETATGKGLVLNGLDPLEDYKVFCYVRQA